jgi:undecaprenyl-diphosphatase
MPIWHAVVLGIVQGLTEFLPISSTAHLIVAQRLLGRSEQQVKDDPFTVAIQLGTLVAVFVYFRSDIARLIKAFFRDLAENRIVSSATRDGRIAKLIILGTIPVGVCGLLLKKTLERHFYNPMSIGVVAVVFALLMLASEWWAKRRIAKGLTPRTDRDITLFDALFVGFAQCLALMPGGSRSGTTITAGLFAGLDRAAAARFSFLLSIPALLAAGGKDLSDKRKELLHGDSLLSLGVGLAVSALVGYVCIAWLLKFLSTNSTVWFVVYRVAFGGLLIALAAAGWFA